MAAKSAKSWYRYTDESGKCWRIQTTAALAEIGGLDPTDPGTYPPLSSLIKPRYVWLKEIRPGDRLATRLKVILERDELKNVWGQRFEVSGKEMFCQSYYGEVMNIK